jgi:GTP-binding protein Era
MSIRLSLESLEFGELRHHVEVHSLSDRKKSKKSVDSFDAVNLLAEIKGELRPPGHRSGFVAIVGRPNAGKSTLLNRILKQKIAIITHKPGTTRRRLLGVYTQPKGQIVFIDTPGLERSESKLGRFLLEEAKASVAGVDLILFMTDGFNEAADLQAVKLLETAGIPFFFILNKVDLIKDKRKLLPLFERYSQLGHFEEFFPISALRGQNVESLVTHLLERLPEGPRYYPPGAVTDVSEKVLAAEFVREQVYHQLHREVPYAVAVQVLEMVRDEGSGLIYIEADIYVERKSQRGIVVGKGGDRLKKIGQAAREEIESRLGEKVFLGLHVRIKPNWRQRDSALHDLGFKIE